MNDEAHGHLEGGVPEDDVEHEHGEEADEWERMVAVFRTAAPRGAAPPWLEQRVMAEVEALPEQTMLGRVIAWLIDPTPVRVSPLAAGLVTAAFALVLLLPGRTSTPAPTDGAASGPAVPMESVVYVQFMLEAPGATSVAVAGDFSEWEPSFTLEDVDGDGVWTGRIPVRPGVHGYMFLIDGTDWQTDPHADRYQDDGFGNRNAVLAVAAGA